MCNRDDVVLVWSTDLTTLCEICDERDYGSPCDNCLDEIREICPNCLGLHSIDEQARCYVEIPPGVPPGSET